jgi:two-component system OmpR family sensor kinase
MRQWCAAETGHDASTGAGRSDAGETADALADAARRIAQLEQDVAARDQFIAVIGHEMRNPMVPIVLSVDRARRMMAAGDQDRLRQSLATLELAVGAFVRRATQVLDASRFNAGQFRLDPEPTDLSALVRGVATSYAEMARHAGCAVTTEVADGVTQMCDRGAVQQMLENLLSNALKYGAGRPVTVALARWGNGARLTVRDHGPGIAPADRARIFERFERVAQRGSPGGFGIGLWLVGQLAKAMGATITVDGAAGEGATFSLHLPPNDDRDGARAGG